MTTTLILNKDGAPLSIVPISALSWQEAIKVEWLERATVLEEYEDWVVRSPSIELNVPAVLMLHDYVKVSRTIKFSRYNVFLRDEFKCQYCGFNGEHNVKDLTIDHVNPRYHGGGTHWENVAASCEACNFEKAHHTHMKPKRKPYRPDYWDMAEKRKLFPIAVPHEAWIPWLGWDKDLVAIKH